MRRIIAILLISVMLIPLMASGGTEKASADGTYPAGDIVFWGTGQPGYRQPYYQNYVEEHRDIAPEVNVVADNMSSMADGQQKIAMYALAGDYESMPEFLMLDTVGIIDLASSGLLGDVTDYWNSVSGEFIEGSASDAIINDRVWGLPDAVRPQVLFYNAEIFEKYDIDPAMMSTFEGYLEAGRLLKERSGGTVYLSYVDPGSYTWRYWGRRGLMPQANARIWDENGNVVIGSDPGTKLALEYFDQLYSEGLLYKTTMMSQPIYEAADDGIIATFYIGAFWDEFMRKNLTATAGDWRVMNAPVFEEVGVGGAPVSTFYCIVDKKPNAYTGLIEDIWYDFQTNTEDRNAWVMEMEAVNGPYNNPVSIEMLKDPFWQEPSDFYGGQSFRKAESDGLINAAKNMMVTASDAEADTIISAELEKYIAGEQSIQEAIANMDKELKLRIGTAVLP